MNRVQRTIIKSLVGAVVSGVRQRVQKSDKDIGLNLMNTGIVINLKSVAEKALDIVEKHELMGKGVKNNVKNKKK